MFMVPSLCRQGCRLQGDEAKVWRQAELDLTDGL
jgi:hypothetical protein